MDKDIETMSREQRYRQLLDEQLPDALEIAPEVIASTVAAALIDALNAELLSRYPEPGATHFRLDPDEVTPGNGIPPYGEYTASAGTSVCMAKAL